MNFDEDQLPSNTRFQNSRVTYSAVRNNISIGEERANNIRGRMKSSKVIVFSGIFVALTVIITVALVG